MAITLAKENFLTYLRKEHHIGLVLCQNIHQGLRKNIDPDRIKEYCRWFFNEYIETHFKIEEEYIFPILGNDHAIVKRALKEHRKIKRLIENNIDPIKSVNLLEELLEAHIRFEEKTIFTEIQNNASQEIKNIILHKIHQVSVKKIEEWTDVFWK